MKNITSCIELQNTFEKNAMKPMNFCFKVADFVLRHCGLQGNGHFRFGESNKNGHKKRENQINIGSLIENYKRK